MTEEKKEKLKKLGKIALGLAALGAAGAGTYYSVKKGQQSTVQSSQGPTGNTVVGAVKWMLKNPGKTAGIAVGGKMATDSVIQQVVDHPFLATAAGGAGLAAYGGYRKLKGINFADNLKQIISHNH